MTKDHEKTLRKLRDKLIKARQKGDLITTLRLQKEIESQCQLYITEERMSLKDAMKGYSREEQDEATAMVIYAIATADILCGATIDIENSFRRRFGLDALPILGKLRGIIDELRKVVKTIDDVGSGVFSQKYADMVESIETRYEATMKNYIYNEVMKWCKRKDGNA